MKRLSKKATSLIMALILVFSLSATAFANDTGSSLTRAEVTQEVIKNMGRDERKGNERLQGCCREQQI